MCVLPRDTLRLDINARSEKHNEWKNTATQQLMEMENLNSIILRFFFFFHFFLLLLGFASLSLSLGSPLIPPFILAQHKAHHHPPGLIFVLAQSPGGCGPPHTHTHTQLKKFRFQQLCNISFVFFPHTCGQLFLRKFASRRGLVSFSSILAIV